MLNPQEIATVTAQGQNYKFWESVEVHREFGRPVSMMTLSVAETAQVSAEALSWTSLKLNVGDPIQGYLAGNLVLSGTVTVRQTAYDREGHGVQIVATGYGLAVVKSTVSASPGQYIGYNLQQIAQAVCQQVGCNFVLSGNLPGAEKVFPRVSEHPGEPMFQFIERLARMRDIHIRDDENGNLVGTRGTAGGSIATLVEGQNILSARVILTDQNAAKTLSTIGANIGGSSTGVWGDTCRDIKVTAQNPTYNGRGQITVTAEQPCDVTDAVMRNQHEVAQNALTQVDCEVTVRGWLMDDGSLWIAHLGEPVTVYSPMAFPTDSMQLWLKGVRHRQENDTGTTTVLSLCLPNGLSVEGISATSGDNADSVFPGIPGPSVAD